MADFADPVVIRQTKDSSLHSIRKEALKLYRALVGQYPPGSIVISIRKLDGTVEEYKKPDVSSK